MSASFPKTSRIVGKNDYARVFEQGERIAASCLVLLYQRNSLQHSRLGLAISKKHLAHAVERNRVKRQIREFFRHHKADCEGLDIVIISRHAIADTDNPVLVRCLAGLWRKLEERCAA